MRYIIIAALLFLAIIVLGSCAKQPTINGEPVELIHTDQETKYA